MNFDFKTDTFSLLVHPDLSVHLQKICGTADKIAFVIQTKFCQYSIDIQDTAKLQVLLPFLYSEIQTILATYNLQLVTKNFSIQDNTCYLDFTTREVNDV
ncbi:hypothetical protein FKC55_00725 [Listeria monocytogenes]|nr:hypothetical protein [Listeria monocytogenes]EKR8711460.1 hypothetical protein [Listeria monocytogenes]ELQ0050882.1 hypothetical protein [Listeria monocytogenes]ELQ0053993.1 hypothetical protein [Listeria monocytogenes]HAA6491778.1 hypothetical protein [Listeria monocytogenes]